MNKLLYISSSGIGENIWGSPTIKFLSEKYYLKILCDSNKKNFNFLNRIFDKDNFIFCDNLDAILTSTFLSKEQNEIIKLQIPKLIETINELGFDSFVYNRWQFNKTFKDKININLNNIIDYQEKDHSMWNPRHETLFKLCGGNINEFNSYYEKVRLKCNTNSKNIIIYQGSIWGGDERKISKDFIIDLVNRLLQQYSDYNFFILQNEDLGIINDKVHLIDSKNYEHIYNLMMNGIELFIGPDSGMRWFSQLFGIKNILISEHPRFTKQHVTFNSLLDITELSHKNIDQIMELSKNILISSYE